MSNVGQIITGIVAIIAAVVVTYYFGPYYGYATFAIIMGIGSALFPADTEKPRPQDLQFQTSMYGGTIPLIYGTRKISGNCLWYANYQAHEQTASGGKGGGDQVTGYAYSVSLAFGLCMNTAGARGMDVTRMWNGKNEVNLGALIAADGIRMYDGNQISPDSHMASFVVRPPIWKGLVYVVLPNFNLGNSPYIPNLTFEVGGVLDVRPCIIPCGSGSTDPVIMGRYLHLLTESCYIARLNLDTMEMDTTFLAEGDAYAMGGYRWQVFGLDSNGNLAWLTTCGTKHRGSYNYENLPSTIQIWNKSLAVNTVTKDFYDNPIYGSAICTALLESPDNIAPVISTSVVIGSDPQVHRMQIDFIDLDDGATVDQVVEVDPNYSNLTMDFTIVGDYLYCCGWGGLSRRPRIGGGSWEDVIRTDTLAECFLSVMFYNDMLILVYNSATYHQEMRFYSPHTGGGYTLVHTIAETSYNGKTDMYALKDIVYDVEGKDYLLVVRGDWINDYNYNGQVMMYDLSDYSFVKSIGPTRSSNFVLEAKYDVTDGVVYLAHPSTGGSIIEKYSFPEGELLLASPCLWPYGDYVQNLKIMEAPVTIDRTPKTVFQQAIFADWPYASGGSGLRTDGSRLIFMYIWMDADAEESTYPNSEGYTIRDVVAQTNDFDDSMEDFNIWDDSWLNDVFFYGIYAVMLISDVDGAYWFVTFKNGARVAKWTVPSANELWNGYPESMIVNSSDLMIVGQSDTYGVNKVFLAISSNEGTSWTVYEVCAYSYRARLWKSGGSVYIICEDGTYSGYGRLVKVYLWDNDTKTASLIGTHNKTAVSAYCGCVYVDGDVLYHLVVFLDDHTPDMELYKSTNHGVDWTLVCNINRPVASPNYYPDYALGVHGDNIVIADQTFLFSKDGGDTWDSLEFTPYTWQMGLKYFVYFDGNFYGMADYMNCDIPSGNFDMIYKVSEAFDSAEVINKQCISQETYEHWGIGPVQGA